MLHFPSSICGARMIDGVGVGLGDGWAVGFKVGKGVGNGVGRGEDRGVGGLGTGLEFLPAIPSHEMFSEFKKDRILLMDSGSNPSAALFMFGSMTWLFVLD